MLRILLSALASACLLVSAMAETGDAAIMAAIMMKTWDRPDARLTVEPVVIEDDAAVAGWTQEDRGGRALFRKRAGEWTMVLCAGAALREEKGLAAAGLPQALARKLASAVVTAEAALPRTAVQAFDSFEGTVTMSDGDHDAAPEGIRLRARAIILIEMPISVSTMPLGAAPRRCFRHMLTRRLLGALTGGAAAYALVVNLFLLGLVSPAHASVVPDKGYALCLTSPDGAGDGATHDDTGSGGKAPAHCPLCVGRGPSGGLPPQALGLLAQVASGRRIRPAAAPRSPASFIGPYHRARGPPPPA